MFAPTHAPSRGSRLPFPALLYGGILAAGIALGAAPLAEYGWGETGTQLFARYTARFSVLLFLLVFITRPLFDVWPATFTRTLLRRRRHLGLGFALAHGIHLLALLSFLRVQGVGFEPSDIVPGIAYLFIGLMAITSNGTSVRRLGPWWKRLHRTGLYVVFLVFLGAYGGRVFGDYGAAAVSDVPAGSYPAHAAVFALLLAALGLRVLAWPKRRRPSR